MNKRLSICESHIFEIQSEKMVYYALCIEFKMRGSTHLHVLIWTNDSPKLTHETKQYCIDFIDDYTQAYLPHEKTGSKEHDVVTIYQKYNHLKDCRNYKNIPCRFNFGQFFTKRTVVAEPFSKESDEESKMNILTRRNVILIFVKKQIDKA